MGRGGKPGRARRSPEAPHSEAAHQGGAEGRQPPPRRAGRTLQDRPLLYLSGHPGASFHTFRSKRGVVRETHGTSERNCGP